MFLLSLLYHFVGMNPLMIFGNSELCVELKLLRPAKGSSSPSSCASMFQVYAGFSHSGLQLGEVLVSFSVAAVVDVAAAAAAAAASALALALALAVARAPARARRDGGGSGGGGGGCGDGGGGL